MYVRCECCVLSGGGLCDGLITRPEESYQPWWVVVCDIENLVNEEELANVGQQRHKNVYTGWSIKMYKHFDMKNITL